MFQVCPCPLQTMHGFCQLPETPPFTACLAEVPGPPAASRPARQPQVQHSALPSLPSACTSSPLYPTVTGGNSWRVGCVTATRGNRGLFPAVDPSPLQRGRVFRQAEPGVPESVCVRGPWFRMLALVQTTHFTLPLRPLNIKTPGSDWPRSTHGGGTLL